ncbi:MAG: rhomboid family intramembrane serine protease [Candidatus Diapherotrites archaeon]
MKKQKLKIKFIASSFLALLLFVLFFYFSKGKYFIPMQDLFALSFNFEQPLNILSYMFIHIGLFHLFVNIFSLALFALILEQVTGSKHLIALFFFSGFLGAILFALYAPDTGLMGASIGISGLLTSSLLLKPKHTIIGIIIIAVMLLLALIPFSQNLLSAEKKVIVQKEEQISVDLNKAVEKKDTNKAVDLNRQLQKVVIEKKQFEQGEQFQIETKTNPLSHAFGAIAGIIYLYAFQRKKLKEKIKEIVLWIRRPQFHSLLP